jgi:O-antigen/teichoic acid export membrane protein
VVLFAADHLDRILLGRLAGPDAVGLYGQAKNLMIKPVYLVTAPLSVLVLSSLARAAGRRNVQAELAEAFYRILAIILLPICVGLALVGDDVMPCLGGPRWTSSGVLLSALSVALFAQAVLIINGWLLAAFGRTGCLFAAAVVVLSIQTLGYLIGWRTGSWYGNAALGVAWGYSAAVVGILVLPHTVFAFRVARLPVVSFVRAIRRPLAASLGMAVVVWAAGAWLERAAVATLWAKLLTEIAIGALVYILLARGELRWLRGHWQQLRGHR